MARKRAELLQNPSHHAFASFRARVLSSKSLSTISAPVTVYFSYIQAERFCRTRLLTDVANHFLLVRTPRTASQLRARAINTLKAISCRYRQYQAFFPLTEHPPT